MKSFPANVFFTHQREFITTGCVQPTQLLFKPARQRLASWHFIRHELRHPDSKRVSQDLFLVQLVSINILLEQIHDAIEAFAGGQFDREVSLKHLLSFELATTHTFRGFQERH